MDSGRRTLDELREDRTELENHHIDELLAGSLSRRQFLRRASVIGMSAPLAGAIVAACGGANSSAGSSTSTAAGGGKPTKGGTLRLAMLAPGARLGCRRDACWSMLGSPVWWDGTGPDADCRREG